jgi:hypothetical protein
VLGAFFADASISNQSRRRAEEAIIIDTLYDRDTLVTARVVDRRAKQNKCVIDVGDVGPLLANQRTHAFI